MLADTLRGLRGRRLTDDDGNPDILELLPPATAAELAEFEKHLPARPPHEIREALAVSRGLENGPLESWDLIGLGGGFGLEDVFPTAHSIAHDGYGNYWVLDLRPETTSWGPVYYACHDPPVIVYQASTIEEFLLQTVRLWEPGPRSAVDVVHEDATSTIWKKNPGLISQPDAARSGDSELRNFASDLPPDFRIADLRQARTGHGFSWGRYGPMTKWRHHPSLPIWAAGKPSTSSRIRAWLFGR